jgi:hypothetical protein
MKVRLSFSYIRSLVFWGAKFQTRVGCCPLLLASLLLRPCFRTARFYGSQNIQCLHIYILHSLAGRLCMFALCFVARFESALLARVHLDCVWRRMRMCDTVYMPHLCSMYSYAYNFCRFMHYNPFGSGICPFSLLMTCSVSFVMRCF